MTDGKLIGVGGVGLLAVICCAAAPFLLIAIGFFGISAWLATIGYVFIPIALVAIGMTGLYLYRRSHSASSASADCCPTNTETKRSN